MDLKLFIVLFQLFNTSKLRYGTKTFLEPKFFGILADLLRQMANILGQWFACFCQC